MSDSALEYLAKGRAGLLSKRLANLDANLRRGAKAEEIREAAQEVIFEATQMLAAHDGWGIVGELRNVHRLNEVFLFACERGGVTLDEVAEAFTGGNFVVAKAVVDELQGRGLIDRLYDLRGSRWTVAFRAPQPLEQVA